MAMAVLAAAIAFGVTACASPTEPTPVAEFIVDVGGEQFVVRTSDAESIQLAEEHLQGRNQRFPLGSLRAGNGGFNAPWTWHLDAATVRFVEAAIEICDGRPSYVEAHQSDFPTYCPWAARVIARR